jgi:hypothetical protein
MPHIELRLKAGERSPGDLKVSVQDRTFEYLRDTVTPEIRISAFLDEDAAHVEKSYVEVFVTDECAYHTLIEQIIPGSRERRGSEITLPAPMHKGEQLTIIVKRKRK